MERFKCFIRGHRWKSDEEVLTEWVCKCGSVLKPGDLVR